MPSKQHLLLRPLVRRRRRAAVLLALALAAAAGSLATAAAHQPVFPRLHEANVCKLPGHVSGEPSITVNPKNPLNIVIVCFSNAQFSVVDYGDVRGTSNPFEVWVETEAYTFDGGRSWKTQKLPITDQTYSYTSDPQVLFTPDGTLFATSSVATEANTFGGSPVIVSKDGGRTWSKKVFAQGWQDFEHQARAGFIREIPGPATGYERPWMGFDATTGDLYMSAVSFFEPHAGPPDTGRLTNPAVGNFRRYVNVSHDRGKTWSLPVPIDSDSLPSGDSGWLAVNHGVVMVTYAPAGGAPCACSVVATSTDRGKTWKQSLLSSPPGGLQAPWVAANQRATGHFAVLNTRPTSSLEVSVTENAGRTWRKTVVKAARGEGVTPIKGRIAYSPTGVLGLVWRNQYADMTYDTWVAISRNNGKTFEPAVKLSAGRSTADATNGLTHDDASDLALDGRSVVATWGDQRSGVIDSWFGRYVFDGPTAPH